MSSAPEVKVIGTLVGDIYTERPAQTKYGQLFKEVQNLCSNLELCDATLRGMDRWLNLARMFHYKRSIWKERFYQNVPAFNKRSQRAGQQIYKLQKSGQANVVLQVGVTFDASYGKHTLPNVIYTDYTTDMAMQQPDAGRSPFSEAVGQRLIKLEQQAFEHAYHVCTRSEIVRQSILNDYGIDADKVSVIGGGVNFEILPELNVPTRDGKPTVLFIGKDFYRKGGDLLLNAFAQTREHIPGTRLLMMTEGPIPADLPMEGVEVIAPTWDRDVIANLYRRADLFVLPSRLETWGDVLLEAMAYGIPCIGATRQAMGEIIMHGKTGLVIPPGDEYSLYSALLWLMINPWLREKWGKAGRERLEEHFTWERVACKLQPILEAAVAQNN
ncbi:MAG: glycosyltransferase family 4 protein [Anaerolineales bacterium]|nr:glycosyltransferase family 4 protein [Anaerolineales bacterium]